MRNAHAWKPGFVCVNADGSVRADLSRVYGGSQHITSLQVPAVSDCINRYAYGEVLDAGCGSMPYYELVRKLSHAITALDHDEKNPYADHICDLNLRWPCADQSADTILLLDVIAHVKNPAHVFSECARCLKPGGRLILSTPFVYWNSMHPHDYFHPSASALEMLAHEAGLRILQLDSYGGYPDVLLDTLNKGAASGMKNKLFRMFKSLVIKTAAYRKSNEKTKYSYPLGYVCVATK